MAILYLLGIRAFYFMVVITSLFNQKAKLWLKGRKNIFEKLKVNIEPNDEIAWFHCASLGEFEQGRPVMEAFKKDYPQYKILLTFFSPSGYEIRKDYAHADFVYYLPLDTPGNAKRFIETVRPKMVFFIKYEFWYFFLREINKKGIPLYLVSGIFRPGQRFFKKYAVKSRRMLDWFTHFFVQNEESKNLLNSIHIEKVTIAGDTRFDRVHSITKNLGKLPLVEKFAGDKLVLIGGSTWKPGEELLIKYFKNSNTDFKLIIAPHEIHKDNIERIAFDLKGEKVIKYSEANEHNIIDKDVLIIDAIGFLSSVYQYGSVAYIGGGFGKGIHNILEAATFGLPIIFGPNYFKFKEALELNEQGGAFPVSNYSELKDKMDYLMSDSKKLNTCGKISARYVNENIGATKTILEFINFQ